MGTKIHPTAIVDPSAELGMDVEIGPYACLGPDIQIGSGTRIGPHAVIENNCIIGENCRIWPGAIVGGKSQDYRVSGDEETSGTRIGNEVTIREYVTVNRSNLPEQHTLIGDGCVLMAYSHVGHDCVLGNQVVLANAVQVGGLVRIDEQAILGGSAVVHQFSRVGRLAMVAGNSTVRQDIPPFSLAADIPAAVYGINTVGLRRRGFSQKERNLIKRIYRYLLSLQMNRHQAMAAIEAELAPHPFIDEILTFIRNSQRGIRFRSDRKRAPSSSSSSPEPGQERI